MDVQFGIPDPEIDSQVVRRYDISVDCFDEFYTCCGWKFVNHQFNIGTPFGYSVASAVDDSGPLHPVGRIRQPGYKPRAGQPSASPE